MVKLEPRGRPLRNVVTEVHVAFVDEDVAALLKTLAAEGFLVKARPSSYSEVEREYSANIRCLLTHMRIWRECSKRPGLTMVVEADFVPVKHLGSQTVPEGWIQRPGFAWLYSVSPTFYHLDETGAAIGDGGGTVAYVLDGRTAEALLDFADGILDSATPGAYRLWETEFRTYLRWKRSIPTYLPYRHYGEHGGQPNPEHKRHRGFPPHRADCLLGALEFLPLYAKGSRVRLAVTRARAKVRGVARLLAGRAYPLQSFRNEPNPRLVWFAIARLLCTR